MAETEITEIWVPVQNHEPYEISNAGRVRRGEKILKTWICGSGYEVAEVRCGPKKGRTKKKAMVHRLVAAAFIGPCQESHQVNHKNGNKTDNRASNLEYVTPSQNALHAQRIGRKGTGERHPSAKLTADKVREIRSLRKIITRDEIAKRFGIGISTVDCIFSRRIWKHV